MQYIWHILTCLVELGAPGKWHFTLAPPYLIKVSFWQAQFYHTQARFCSLWAMPNILPINTCYEIMQIHWLLLNWQLHEKLTSRLFPERTKFLSYLLFSIKRTQRPTPTNRHTARERYTFFHWIAAASWIIFQLRILRLETWWDIWLVLDLMLI